MSTKKELLNTKVRKSDWPVNKYFIPTGIGRIEIHGDLYYGTELVDKVTFYDTDDWEKVDNIKSMKSFDDVGPNYSEAICTGDSTCRGCSEELDDFDMAIE